MYQRMRRETRASSGYPTNPTRNTHMWAYTDAEQDWLSGSAPAQNKHKRVSNQTASGQAPQEPQHRNRIYEKVTFDGKEYTLPMMI